LSKHSGKSHFICALIEHQNELFTSRFHRIILCQHENLSYRQNETFESIHKSFPGMIKTVLLDKPFCNNNYKLWLYFWYIKCLFKAYFYTAII